MKLKALGYFISSNFQYLALKIERFNPFAKDRQLEIICQNIKILIG